MKHANKTQSAWRWMLATVAVACGACGDEGALEAPAKGPEPVNDAGLLEPCVTCGADTECTEEVAAESALHVSTPRTDDPAPAGGDHHPCWADYGVYATPLAAEYWLHNLEHGAVAFLFHCPEGCDAERAQLEAMAAERPRAIVTEYPHMSARFAAVSWGRRLESVCLDVEAFAEFYEVYADRAPEYVTAGAPAGCPGNP